MVAFGYTVMGEQAGPKQLVADAPRAEAAGFDFIAASDHYFPWLAELPTHAHFAAASTAVREEDVARQMPCGPDVDVHVEAVKRYVDAGFTHVAVVQIGGEYQDTFFPWAENELLPALRQLG